MNPLIITENIGTRQKAAILQEIFPHWKVIPCLNKTQRIEYVSDASTNYKKVYTEDLTPSENLKLYMDQPIQAEIAQAIQEHKKAGGTGVIIVSDPDPIWEIHAFQLHNYLAKNKIPAFHLHTKCMEEKWLESQVINYGDRLLKQHESGVLQPPVMIRAEAAILAININVFSYRILRQAAKEPFYDESNFNFNLPEVEERVKKAQTVRGDYRNDWMTRANFLIIQALRSIHQETKEVFHEIFLIESKNPKKDTSTLSVKHMCWKMAMPNTPMTRRFFEETKQQPYPLRQDMFDRIWHNNDALREQLKGKIMVSNYSLDSDKEEGITTFRIEDKNSAIGIAKELQTPLGLSSFRVLGRQEQGDAKSMKTPLNLHEFIEESISENPLKDIKIANDTTEEGPHNTIEWIPLLFNLYNLGMITWPKIAGATIPPHIAAAFSKEHPGKLSFDKQRNPHNQKNIDTLTDWIICPTGPHVLNQKNLTKALLEYGKRKRIIFSQHEINRHWKLLVYINIRFYTYSLLPSPHTHGYTWCIGPVNERGEVIDPENCHFFAKPDSHDKEENLSLKPGSIIQLKPVCLSTHAEGLNPNENSLLYLLIRYWLLQPATVTKNLKILADVDAITTRVKMRRTLDQAAIELRSLKTKKDPKDSDKIHNLSRWITMARKILRTNNAEDPDPNSFVPTVKTERMMLELERMFPLLIMPKEVQKLQKEIQKVGNGISNADHVWNDWRKKLRSQISNKHCLDVYNKQEIRKFSE